MNERFKPLEEKLTRAVSDLDMVQTQVHEPGQWNSQQIVEHLILSYGATVGVLRTRIDKQRPTQATPTLVQHCQRAFVVRLGNFPRGVAAPAEVTPPSDTAAVDGEHLTTRFRDALSQMDVALDEVGALFGDKTRSASHMILGPLNPPEWRRFHVVHGLHHILQIEALRRKQGLS